MLMKVSTIWWHVVQAQEKIIYWFPEWLGMCIEVLRKLCFPYHVSLYKTVEIERPVGLDSHETYISLRWQISKWFFTVEFLIFEMIPHDFFEMIRHDFSRWFHLLENNPHFLSSIEQVECTKYVEKIPRHVCDHDPADLNAVPTEEQANSLEAEAEENNEVTFYTLPMPKVYGGSVPSVPLAYPYNPYLVQY